MRALVIGLVVVFTIVVVGLVINYLGKVDASTRESNSLYCVDIDNCPKEHCNYGSSCSTCTDILCNPKGLFE